MTLSIDEAKALVIEFCATYPVASSIGYKLRETQEELYGSQATREAAGTILGSFRARRGRADFAISNFRDANHFRRVIRHEILGHFGINTFNPEEKRAVLDRLIDARTEPVLADYWAAVDKHYPQLSESRKAEEVFAFACENIDPQIRADAALGIEAFRDTCIERARPMQISDLINLTAMVAEGMHDRSRSQQNFPASDDAQFKLEQPTNTSEYPTWLAVPHDERDAAREAAGKLENGQWAIGWGKDCNLWFARPGADLDRVAQWLPDLSVRAGGGEARSEFLDALTQEGLIVKGMPIMNGKRQRVATLEDRHGKKSGIYCGFTDRRPGGWFINYHRASTPQDITRWLASGAEYDPVTSLHIRAGAQQSKDDMARAQERRYAQATLAAKHLYDQLPAADPAHPYLVRKGIPPTPELRQTRNGALVVPFFNAQGIFKTLQYIPPDGGKYVFKDAPKQGHFLVVGGALASGQPVQYAEGYATARSLNLATGHPVVMTIDAGNMVEVAKTLHALLPDSRHLFYADFDHAKEQNKGLQMATAAAEKIGGQVLYPDFTDAEKALGFTDYNDLHHSRGLEAVRSQVLPLLAQEHEVPTMQDHSNPSREDMPDIALADNLDLFEQDAQVMPEPLIESATEFPPQYPDASPIESASASDEVIEPAIERTADLPETPMIEQALPDANDDVAPQSPVELPVDSTAASDEVVQADIVPPAVLPEPEDRVVEADLAVNESPVVMTTGDETRGEPTLSDPTAGPLAAASVQQSIVAPVVLPRPADVVEPPPVVNEPPIVAATGEKERIEPTLNELDVPPRKATQTAEPASESAVDAIWLGPPRPIEAGDESAISLIDKDALLTRLTWEKQGDTAVLYKLDGEPAFIDRASRLEMAPGASDSDDKIMAALLTAMKHYRDRIELTGSDAFKEKAIGLIAQQQLNVTMKNPLQQAMLDDARKALVVEPVARDAIAGDAPSLSDLASQPQAAAEPVAEQPSPVGQPTRDNSPPAPTQNALPAEPAPKLDEPVRSGKAAIHQTAEAAKNGVVGKVMACGDAPFKFDEKNTPSTFIKLRTQTGVQTFWGKELAGLLRDTRVQPGKIVTLQWLGKEPVVVKVPRTNDAGVVTHHEDKNAHRNQWSLAISGQPTVRTGQDEGVKLAPYDAVRFAVVQQAVIKQLALGVPMPAAPVSGLYWMTPDGQGSARAGDELTAPRPAIDPQKTAGQPVISRWTEDGHLDMHLVRGDGPYLQGVVRQGGQLQHVLVSLPGSPDAPAMVFNAITPEGLVPIGTGNGINRSGGEPVSRENIAFKLEGDSATRIGKLDAPADIPPALHARLGFDERWKAESNLPKSAPTAAPSVQPSDPRPV